VYLIKAILKVIKELIVSKNQLKATALLKCEADYKLM